MVIIACMVIFMMVPRSVKTIEATSANPRLWFDEVGRCTYIIWGPTIIPQTITIYDKATGEPLRTVQICLPPAQP